jgi:hypothetical protein
VISQIRSNQKVRVHKREPHSIAFSGDAPILSPYA